MNKVSKTIIAVLSSIGLTFGLFSAPANAAAVTVPNSALVGRAINSHSFILKANETLEVGALLNASVMGANGVAEASSNLAIVPQAGVIEVRDANWYWSAYGDECQNESSTVTFVPCSAATSISVNLYQTVINLSEEEVIVQVNTGTASISLSGSTITNYEPYTYADRTVSPEALATGIVSDVGDSSVRAFFTVCLEDSVAPGEILEWETSATKNGGAHSPNWTYTNNGNSLVNITVAATPVLEYRVLATTDPATAGTYTHSVDLQKDGVSVLVACPEPAPPEPLFSLGGASVSGTFSVGSTLTATPNTWSRTDGGPLVTTDNSFVWYLCSVPQSVEVFLYTPGQIPCFEGDVEAVLSGGTAVGPLTQFSQPYFGSTLQITEGILNAMLGKHLMVASSGIADNPFAFSEVYLKSCGPISPGLACASPASPVVDQPTVTTPALLAQTAPKAVPAKFKVKKKLTIPAKTSVGLPIKVTVSGACKVKPVIKKVTTKVKVGKKTKKVKTKVITKYTVTMGKKKGATCTITQFNAGDATYAALNSVSVVTLRK